MTAAETIGLCIITVGIALMPVGYYADQRIYFLAFVVVVIGLLLMLWRRNRDDADSSGDSAHDIDD